MDTHELLADVFVAGMKEGTRATVLGMVIGSLCGVAVVVGLFAHKDYTLKKNQSQTKKEDDLDLPSFIRRRPEPNQNPHLN